MFQSDCSGEIEGLGRNIGTFFLYCSAVLSKNCYTFRCWFVLLHRVHIGMIMVGIYNGEFRGLLPRELFLWVHGTCIPYHTHTHTPLPHAHPTHKNWQIDLACEDNIFPVLVRKVWNLKSQSIRDHFHTEFTKCNKKSIRDWKKKKKRKE